MNGANSFELFLETGNAIDILYKVSYLISKSLFTVNITLFTKGYNWVKALR